MVQLKKDVCKLDENGLRWKCCFEKIKEVRIALKRPEPTIVEFDDNNVFELFATRSVFGHIKASNLHVVAAILTYIMSISSNVCLSNPYHSP